MGWIEALAALLLALPIITTFLKPGLPLAADSEIHLHRIASMVSNLEAGHLWARWTPYLHQGFGYPIHNFYAPGLHLIGAHLHLATGLDLVTIYKLLLFGIILLYPLGAYGWTRKDFGTMGGLVAAAAYLYVPFRFHELLAQQNLSQFAAMALLPFLLWAIRRVADVPVIRRAAQLGLLYGAAVLLHHPTALLFSPFAGLYALLILGHQPTRKWILRSDIMVATGIGLGVAMSAAFWLPALLELRYTQISSFQTGILSIAANFVSFSDLIGGVGMADMTRFGLPSMLQVGLVPLLAGIAGLAGILAGIGTRRVKLRRRARRTVVFGMAMVGMCLFLITPASEAIWTRLPLANLIVYPWRLLGVIAVMVLPGAAAIPKLFRQRWQSHIAGGVIGLIVCAMLPLMVITMPFTDTSAVSAQDTLDYERRTGNVGLTSGDEYLPVWAEERPLATPAGDFSDLGWRVYVQSSEPKAAAESIDCDKGSVCFHVDAPSATTLTMDQLYFPGWTATLDGETVELEPTPVTGLMRVNVPQGDHQLVIRYSGTDAQHVGEAVSGAAAILLVIGLLWRVPQKYRPTQWKERPYTPLVARIGIVMIAIAVINPLWVVPQTTLFRVRSDVNAPPAQYAADAVYGETIELLGYDLSTTEAKPGDTVMLRLYWRLIQPTALSLHGGVALTSKDGREVWANATSLNLGGGISTAAWSLDQYVVDTYTLHIAPDAHPYTGEIRVSVFSEAEGEFAYLPLADGESAAVVGDLRLSGNDAPIELTNVDVQFEDAIRLLGYALTDEAGQPCVMLRWEALRGDLPELAVMLHVLDADGGLITPADAAPLNDLYPTNQWQQGQQLNDQHCLSLPVNADALAIGLYRRSDGGRLSAQGVDTQEDALRIQLKEG